MQPVMLPFAFRRPRVSDDEDAPLLHACRAGDTEAYGVLVRQHEGRVRSLLARVLGPAASRDDVDDLLQDVFVQAWRSLPAFRGDAKFGTWLHRVAVNMAVRRARRLRPSVTLDAVPDAADPSPGPQGQAVRKAQDDALRLAVSRLPEKQRLAVVLCYWDGQTCDEAAQILNVPVGTVWSRLHGACRRLRVELSWLENEQ